MLWCVSFRLRAFGTVSLLHETRCKMGQPGAINARVRATKFHQNFSKQNFWQRTLPIYTIGPQTHVLVVLLEFFATNAPDPHHWTLNSCFGSFLSVQVHFGTVLLLHETWCKTRQTGAINAKVRATMSC